MSLGRRNDVVKSLEPISTVVDSGSGAAPDLIVGSASAGNLIEAPSTDCGSTGGGDVRESGVNVSLSGLLGEPVGVLSDKDIGAPSESELLPRGFDESNMQHWLGSCSELPRG